MASQLMRRPSCTEKCATTVCKTKRSLRVSAALSGDQPGRGGDAAQSEVRNPGSNHQLDARPRGPLDVLHSAAASEYKEQDLSGKMTPPGGPWTRTTTIDLAAARRLAQYSWVRGDSFQRSC